MPTLKRILFYIAINILHMGVGYVILSSSALLFPLVISQLKVPAEDANLLFGTGIGIVSFFIQPIIGTISDNCSAKLGRRRPFIILGTIFASIGMYLMGQSPRIGKFLGDPKEFEMNTEIHRYGLIVALIGSMCGAFGSSLLSIPSKALVSDIIPIEEQHTVQLIGVMIMKGNDFVYYLLAAFLSQTTHFYEIMFTIGIITLIITATITVIFVKEEKVEKTVSCGKQIVDIGNAVKNCPKRLALLMLVMFSFFISLAPYMSNLNNFVAVNLLHGNSLTNDSQYQKGIQTSLLTLAFASIVSSICSFILPVLVKRHEITFYIVSVLFAFISMVGYITLHYIAQAPFSTQTSVSIGLALITSMTQISLIAPFSIPMAVFKKVCPPKQLGVYHGISSSIMMIANTIASLICGFLVDLENNLVAVFYYIAVCMFISFCLSFLMNYINKNPKSLESDSYDSVEYINSIIDNDEENNDKELMENNDEIGEIEEITNVEDENESDGSDEMKNVTDQIIQLI